VGRKGKDTEGRNVGRRGEGNWRKEGRRACREGIEGRGVKDEGGGGHGGTEKKKGRREAGVGGVHGGIQRGHGMTIVAVG
jgi:hypothetical protein